MIDLRSDTVTKPSEAMREAMMSAPVGDDVYGDDPTMNALEIRVAKIFGKEAALFAPTGSLANQLAIKSLVKPGEELITETNSHIVRAELGAGAVFSGITTRTWLAQYGKLKASDAIEISKPDSGPYLVSTTAIAIENTHNFGGGSIQDINEIKALYSYAKTHSINLHLDGARLWNAQVVTGIDFAEYGKYFETISVCLSKGLGAPVGSLMISTKERIASARVWRKRYGAGMRQIGMLAAAGDFALTNNISRLSEDHKRAKALAIACAKVAPETIDPKSVETNIVALELSKLSLSAQELNEKLKAEGILASALGPNFLRLVTHLDFSDNQLEKVIEVLPKLLKNSLMA